MIFAPLVGIAMVLTVSTGPIHETDPTVLHLTAREKNAAVGRLVERATECIAGHVVADTRFATQTGAVGDLIVESVPACLEPVRAMIDAYDAYYGAGTGEAFFLGPYLDVLPTAVTRRHENAPRVEERSDNGNGLRR
jgi:hypothetical protein